MKYFIIIKTLMFGLIIMLFNSCTSQQPIYKNLWQVNDFTSANNKELQEPLRFCDKKSKLQYNITNDDKKIYICVKATDELFQMKIIRAGMQINIDTTGKGIQQIGILFPIASKEKPKMPADMKHGQEKNIKNSIKTQLFLEQKEMQLSGFKSPINGKVPLKNEYGILVNIDWDSLNNMYYKVIIPFNTFYKERLTLSDSIKVFDFSFTVNAIEMADNKMGGPRGEGNRPNGGNMPSGEMSGGGMGSGERMGRGGPPSGGREGMQIDNSFSEKNIIKVKIKMAVK